MQILMGGLIHKTASVFKHLKNKTNFLCVFFLPTESADAQISSLGSDLAEVSINDLIPITHGNISLTNISVDSTINSCPEPMDTGVCQSMCLCV